MFTPSVIRAAKSRAHFGKMTIASPVVFKGLLTNLHRVGCDYCNANYQIPPPVGGETGTERGQGFSQGQGNDVSRNKTLGS